MRLIHNVFVPAILLCTTRMSLAGDSWPEWRGATGQGISDATNVPTSWSEKENIAWKTKVPGLGWSSPIVADGKVWVTTAIDVPASEEDAERRRKASTNSQPLIISESVSLRAVSLDLETGELHQNIEVLTEQEPQEIHIKNSYASPTPIIENGRLYCHYGPYGTACIDVKSGEVLWTNRSLRVKHENGPGSSPILWNDLLIVHCDGIDQQYIVALDKRTGKQVWKTPRTGKLGENVQTRKAYATSLVIPVNGDPQVISPAADWVYGYEPSSGRELWKLSYGELGFSNSARPIAGHGLIYICTGYMQSRMLAVKVEEQNGKCSPEIAWQYKRQVPNVASPLLIGQEIYFASDNGIASCIDAKTGEPHWTERIGRRFWASPLYADGKIYFFDDDGTTTVIAPGKTYRQLFVNKLEGIQLATAAAIDGALILRTDEAIYCVR